MRHDLIYPINISVLVFSEFKYILQQKIKDSSDISYYLLLAEIMSRLIT